jgi:hypothetical protein
MGCGQTRNQKLTHENLLEELLDINDPKEIKKTAFPLSQELPSVSL